MASFSIMGQLPSCKPDLRLGPVTAVPVKLQVKFYFRQSSRTWPVLEKDESQYINYI